MSESILAESIRPFEARDASGAGSPGVDSGLRERPGGLRLFLATVHECACSADRAGRLAGKTGDQPDVVRRPGACLPQGRPPDPGVRFSARTSFMRHLLDAAGAVESRMTGTTSPRSSRSPTTAGRGRPTGTRKPVGMLPRATLRCDDDFPTLLARIADPAPHPIGNRSSEISMKNSSRKFASSVRA